MQTVKRLVISAECRRQMLAHVSAGAPEEVCGVLGGQATGRASVVYPIPNVLHSPIRYRMDPQGQLAAFLDLEARGLELTAIYHSHPEGPGFPSATDLVEFAYPGIVTLIWWRSAGGEPGSWRLDGFLIADGGFSVIDLEITANID